MKSQIGGLGYTDSSRFNAIFSASRWLFPRDLSFARARVLAKSLGWTGVGFGWGPWLLVGAEVVGSVIPNANGSGLVGFGSSPFS